MSSVGEGLPLVTTTPDEQSQVFMVMGEDVSKSVVSKGLKYGRRCNYSHRSPLSLCSVLHVCMSVHCMKKVLGLKHYRDNGLAEHSEDC